MEFRARLLATLRVVAPILEQPGVMVVGSEVPNLLEPGAAATLVVSQDVDLAIPVAVHPAVKAETIFLLSADFLGSLPSREQISVRIGPELLSASSVVLTPFERCP